VYFENQVSRSSCGNKPIKVRKTTHYPFQEVFCKKLRGGDIKLWLDPKKDKAVLLLNIAKATKDTNGKFDPQADILHVDYFIRLTNLYT